MTDYDLLFDTHQGVQWILNALQGQTGFGTGIYARAGDAALIIGSWGDGQGTDVTSNAHPDAYLASLINGKFDTLRTVEDYDLGNIIAAIALIRGDNLLTLQSIADAIADLRGEDSPNIRSLEIEILQRFTNLDTATADLYAYLEWASSNHANSWSTLKEYLDFLTDSRGWSLDGIRMNIVGTDGSNLADTNQKIADAQAAIAGSEGVNLTDLRATLLGPDNVNHTDILNNVYDLSNNMAGAFGFVTSDWTVTLAGARDAVIAALPSDPSAGINAHTDGAVTAIETHTDASIAAARDAVIAAIPSSDPTSGINAHTTTTVGNAQTALSQAIDDSGEGVILAVNAHTDTTVGAARDAVNLATTGAVAAGVIAVGGLLTPALAAQTVEINTATGAEIAAGTAATVSGVAAEIAAARSLITAEIESAAGDVIEAVGVAETAIIEACRPAGWPGAANATLGAPVALDTVVEIDAPCDGALIEITSAPSSLGTSTAGSAQYTFRAGWFAFKSDIGYMDERQFLAWNKTNALPKTMRRAGGIVLKCARGVEGTVTPWSYLS